MAVHIEESHKKDLESDPQELLKCNLCDFTHILQRKIYEHKGKTHLLWSCGDCEEEFPKRRKLDYHIRNKHQVTTFDCNKCDFKSKHASALPRHTETMHSEVKLFNCTECGFEFKRKDNLLVHGRKVHSWT